MPLSNLVAKIHACAAADSETMLALFQEYLAQAMNAEKVTWYAGYRGAYGRELWQTRLMDNWKVVDVVFPLGVTRNLSAEMKEYFRQAREEGDIDPQVTLAINSAGQSRAHLLSDAIEASEWQDHWMRKNLFGQGIGERMVGAFHLSDVAESYFLLDRPPEAEPFTEQDKQRFVEELISFPRLHYWLFLERGLVQPAQRPFSPRERSVLRELMGPNSEQEIADQLKLSKGTMHNYVTDIYKNLGVSSRYELMQLWLQPVVSV